MTSRGNKINAIYEIVLGLPLGGMEKLFTRNRRMYKLKNIFKF